MLNIEQARIEKEVALVDIADYLGINCLLYTSDAADD